MNKAPIPGLTPRFRPDIVAFSSVHPRTRMSQSDGSEVLSGDGDAHVPKSA